MKSFLFLFVFQIFAFSAICQEAKQPLYALLSSIKNNSEFLLKRTFTQQELEISIMSDEPKGNKEKEKKRLQNFNTNQACISAYMNLKINVDKLITQLKADLTISNKKKVIKELNGGTIPDDSWYKKNIDEIQKKYIDLFNCVENKSLAVSVEEITGIFSALVSVITSARDFRAQQIKALCEQLDGLRLKDYTELTTGSSSSSDTEGTKEKE